MKKLKAKRSRADLRREFERADKLWKLWRIALRDLRAAERMPNVEINMADWYSREGRTCYVCAAGAVIACRLPVRGQYDIGPWSFDFDICKRLEAINNLRGGYISPAHSEFYGDGRYFANFPMTRYGDDRAAFWRDARKLLAHLRKLDI